MTRNPIIPYVITAVAGIILIVVLSSIGVFNMNNEAGEGGGEQAAANPEEIFQQNCASCHGGNLEGGVGPALNQIGSKLSAEEIADIIQNGKGTGMPAGLVTGEEQQMLAEWLAEKK